MPRLAQLYFKTGIVLLIVGIAMGLMMSISRDHSVMGAHAHLNLLGWVTSGLFGSYLAFNPAKAEGRLPMIQFAVYLAGVLVMVVGLYFYLQGNAGMEPVIATGSFLVAIGVVLFAYMMFAGEPSAAAQGGGKARAS